MQIFLPNAIQNLQIMFRYLLRFRAVFDVFAQMREYRSDPLVSQSICCAKRVLEGLPGIKRDTVLRTKE